MKTKAVISEKSEIAAFLYTYNRKNMNKYRVSIGISKQTRIFNVVSDIFQKIGYALNFGRRGECIIGDIRFVQIKGVEQTSMSLEYGDIDGFIIGSDIAEEVKLNVGEKGVCIEELLDLERSVSRFCLLVSNSVGVDSHKKLSEQFDFLVTKYPSLARKYVGDDITIKKSESDSELLAKRFGVISLEIVQSGETAKQNGLDILGENREVDEKSYLGSIVKNLPQNSVRIFSKNSLDREKKEIIDDFVINIKSVLDALIYDIISFNIRKDREAEVLKLFPGKYPNRLETNDKDYITLRVLIKKYDIASITKVRKMGGKDILVEPLRQVY